jgi:hypothetical protein
MAVVVLMLLTGCHGRKRADVTASVASGRVGVLGRNTIATECEHESYANASKGLIVEETGLHEDVFSLRNRDSLTATAYNLDEALRLEDFLRAAAKAS